MASLERELRRLQQQFRKQDRTHQHYVQEIQEQVAAMQQAAALAQQEQQALEIAMVASETEHQVAIQAVLQAQHNAEEQQLQAMADCEALPALTNHVTSSVSYPTVLDIGTTTVKITLQRTACCCRILEFALSCCATFHAGRALQLDVMLLCNPQYVRPSLLHTCMQPLIAITALATTIILGALPQAVYHRPAGAEWKHKAELAQAELATLKQQRFDALQGKPNLCPAVCLCSAVRPCHGCIVRSAHCWHSTHCGLLGAAGTGSDTTGMAAATAEQGSASTVIEDAAPPLSLPPLSFNTHPETASAQGDFNMMDLQVSINFTSMPGLSTASSLMR